MTSKRIEAAVVVNAFWRGGDAGAERIAAALRRLGVHASLYRTDELFLRVEEEGVKGKTHFDLAVYLDKDIHVARLLEESGVRLFNSAESIRLADDKMLTHIALLSAGIPQPKTVSSPLRFTEGKDDFARKVGEILGYPIVVKKCYGAFGREVYLAKDLAELEERREALKMEPHIYQEYVECGAKDIRVIVIGGKAVAAMRRSATRRGEFRANAELGGSGEEIPLSEELSSLAVRAAGALGLCYAGVDLLESARGLLVTEVNSNAGFRLIEETTGVDVASLYAEYIASEMRKGEEKNG